jgi:hypothetical protein
MDTPRVPKATRRFLIRRVLNARISLTSIPESGRPENGRFRVKFVAFGAQWERHHIWRLRL